MNKFDVTNVDKAIGLKTFRRNFKEIEQVTIISRQLEAYRSQIFDFDTIVAPIDFNLVAKTQAEKAIRFAKLGWYPMPCSPMTANLKRLKSDDLINEFHVKRCKKYFNENRDYCLENAQQRRDVIESGFRLHSIGEFYGSIPIFLAQAEGIYYEAFRRGVFTGSYRSYDNIYQKEPLEEGDVFHAFLAATFVKNQIGAAKDICGKKEKREGPNRNGILHGDIRHADYGNEINSLKAFSLMCFVMWLSAWSDEKKST